MLSPIVLFAYNRPIHTKKTLDALLKNNEAKDSILYIFCDGAKYNSSSENLEQIKEVRTLARGVSGFKQVVVREQLRNKGLASSVIDGVNEVVNEYGKIIVLEDDIVPGEYFLKFMNEALDMYENEDQVFGVSGYTYPAIREIKESTYFLPIASSWGYATWADRWNTVSFNGNDLLSEINHKGLESEMNFGGYNFYKILKHQTTGKNDSWAIRFYVSMFLSKRFFLYPNVSLIDNIGFDNSGTHCTEENYFSKNVASKKAVVIKKLDNLLNDEIVYSVKKSFELKWLKPSSRQSDLSGSKVLIGKGKAILKRMFGI